jgi:hypothetical protein
MAYFAELDENNIVKQVIVVDDNLVDNNEQNGINFLTEHYGHSSWKQTWKENLIDNPRKFYAGSGYTYDSIKNAFIAPRPDGLFSWRLNEITCEWEAPIAKPNDSKKYYWNEESLCWIEDNRFVEEV